MINKHSSASDQKYMMVAINITAKIISIACAGVSLVLSQYYVALQLVLTRNMHICRENTYITTRWTLLCFLIFLGRTAQTQQKKTRKFSLFVVDLNKFFGYLIF